MNAQLPKIGLIGGVSWQSTLLYYRKLNEGVHARLGGHHSARLVIESLDFASVWRLDTRERRAHAEQSLVQAARRLERSGADCLLLASNTLHLFAPAIQEACTLPFLHIAEVTAQAIRAAGIQQVALLGTRFTMSQRFYRQCLYDHGLSVHRPKGEMLYEVHRIIVDELVHGQILPSSKRYYQDVVETLAQRGAQAVILGCTEIPLLLQSTDLALPLFDTTALHVEAALHFLFSSTHDTG